MTGVSEVGVWRQQSRTETGNPTGNHVAANVTPKIHYPVINFRNEGGMHSHMSGSPRVREPHCYWPDSCIRTCVCPDAVDLRCL